MRIIAFFIICSLFMINSASAYDIEKIRKDYVEAVKDTKKCDELVNYLSSIKNPDALILAYLGSAEAIKAKHSWNPYNKMSYLKEGFKKLDAAVKKEPNQLEVRFLRFTLQHYIPQFVGYSKNLNSDKEKIIQLLSSKQTGTLANQKSILKNIVDFLIESKECSDKEVEVLQKLSL